MSLATTITGIHQSDVVIRSAILLAIDDMRRNPWLLDYVFAGLVQDTLTSADYGDNDVQQAKKWFLATNIPVFMNVHLNQAKFPCISIALMESSEAENTFSDVNFDVSEANAQQPPLTAPFTPVNYKPSTGVMVVPAFVATSLILTAGQLVVDRLGIEHPILSVNDDVTIVLDKNLQVDFTNAVIVGAKPGTITTLEGVEMRETYVIGCHAQAEPAHLLYLHSILVFILLSYKESLLEARGFGRSSITSTDVSRNDAIDASEQVFTRFINVSGYVRHMWPKRISQTISAVDTNLRVTGAGKLFPTTYKTQLWVGDGDTDILAGIVPK